MRSSILILLCCSAFYAKTSVLTINQIDSVLDLAESLKGNNTDSCFYFSKLAQEQAQNINYQNGIGRSSHVLGSVYSTYGLFSKAVHQFAKAKMIYQNQNNSIALGNVLINLGEAYYFSDNLALSLNEFQNALTQFEAANHVLGIAKTYSQIGHYYEKQGDYSKALSYQQKALEIYKDVLDKEGLSKVHLNIGSIHEDAEEFERAYVHFYKAFELNEQTNDLSTRVDILNNIGDVFRKTGRFIQGEVYTRKALQLATELNDQRQIQSGLKDLAKTYAKKGIYDSAFFKLDTVLELYKKMFVESNAQQISGIQTLYNLDEQEQELALLKKESELNASRKNLSYITTIALLAMLISIFVFYRFRLRKNKQLHEAEQNLIESKLSVAQEHQQELENELDIKNKALTTYALQTVQDKKVIKDLAQKVEHVKKNMSDSDLQKVLQDSLIEIKSALKQENYWDDFKVFFEQVHPNFLKQLEMLVPKISSAEKRLCTLLKLNMRSKDIATVMRISPDSVRIARYRLRKKLPIEQGEELVSFLNNIEKYAEKEPQS